jgi:hypothetical protein
VAFFVHSNTNYLLAASEAGAAGAAADASAAGAEASAAGAAAGAAGAASTAGASFLPQATRAAAAKRVANRSDFFMSIFLKGGGDKTIFENCHGFHHDRADDLETF